MFLSVLTFIFIGITVCKTFMLRDKVNDYENFLNKAYEEISKYTNLEKINWLIKKEL